MSTAVSEECVACLIDPGLAIHTVIRNPVRAAYLASLESQISSLRDELATVYKTQGQNAQRLLAMNETLREKEELARIDNESLRKAKDELAALRRKVNQHAEVMQEKDRTVQVRTPNISSPWLVRLRDHRFCTMKSVPFSSSLGKSKNAIKTSRKTMLSFFNGG